MRFGIPLLANRVSPRCTIAEGLLVLELDGTLLRKQWVVSLPRHSWSDLLQRLVDERIDTIVCGAIPVDAKADLLELGIEVVENVAETAEATVTAILAGRLRSGFGLEADAPGGDQRPALLDIDCLECGDRRCLRGEPCLQGIHVASATTQPDTQRILEAALDISCEEERNLCRLAEVVYFALEMKYRRLGIAFCWDLAEPTRILVGVLRRFFEVVPVGCKIGGHLLDDVGSVSLNGPSPDHARDIACNPLGQAEALARAGCELNITVGLCLGADCVFSAASRAPVTTLLVKDRSLAHNPIGALYSEYYLKEALHPA
jgi:uncharacterized metal-binding protein/predicted Fe-Mo cluster-binding NifX family protein